MSPSCDRCTCAGRGTCPVCARIKATVRAESSPPKRRRWLNALGGPR